MSGTLCLVTNKYLNWVSERTEEVEVHVQVPSHHTSKLPPKHILTSVLPLSLLNLTVFVAAAAGS